MNINEYVNEKGDKFTILDHHNLSSFISSLSSTISQNAFMRSLHLEDPFKYFDSESILDSMVSRLKIIKINQKTLKLLSSNTNFMNDLTNLLLHPNPDITLHVILFLEEIIMTDYNDQSDKIDNDNNDLDVHIDQFLQKLNNSSKFLDSLLQHTKRLDWNRQEELDSINSIMTIIDGISTINKQNNQNINIQMEQINSNWIEWMTINCIKSKIINPIPPSIPPLPLPNDQHSLFTVKLAISEQLLNNFQIEPFLSVKGINLIMTIFQKDYQLGERDPQASEEMEYIHILANIFCTCFIKNPHESFRQFSSCSLENDSNNCYDQDSGHGNDSNHSHNHNFNQNQCHNSNVNDSPIASCQGFSIFWIILKKISLIRIDIVRILSFILSNCSESCKEFVESGGLRLVFPILNGKGRNSMTNKYHHQYDSIEEERQLVLVILSLILKLPFDSDQFNRVIRKLKEKKKRIVDLFKWSLQHVKEEEYQEQLSILICSIMIKVKGDEIETESNQIQDNENKIQDNKTEIEIKDNEMFLIAHEIAKEYFVSKMDRKTFEFKQLEKIFNAINI